LCRLLLSWVSPTVGGLVHCRETCSIPSGGLIDCLPPSSWWPLRGASGRAKVWAGVAPSPGSATRVGASLNNKISAAASLILRAGQGASGVALLSFSACFYSRPIRQASTECPLSPLQQLNFWMQISSLLSHFPNSNNDHCDLGFPVTACDVVRRPSRGHQVSMEDLRSKGGGGVRGPPLT
jgi:hypothetical protein